MRLLVSIGATLVGVALPTALGFAWPAYDPITSFLSELGATGAPRATLMNFGGFLPASVLWAVGVLSLLNEERTKHLWIGVLLLLGTSISYAGAAFFPCDSGCPMEGSPSQMMHNSLGIVGYLTAPLGMAVIGMHFLRQRQSAAAAVSFLATATTTLGFLMMVVPEMEGARGAWQRLADFSLFIWLITISVILRSRQRLSLDECPKQDTSPSL